MGCTFRPQEIPSFSRFYLHKSKKYCNFAGEYMPQQEEKELRIDFFKKITN